MMLGAAAFFAAIPQAGAVVDAALQMQLGNPSGATADPNNHAHYLIQRTVEAIDYSDTLGEPNWASWDLTAGDIGSSGRSPDFFTDTNLPAGYYEVTPADYNGVGAINFDRGHLCPSDDRTGNVTDNDLVFYMSNIMPQAANNNEGVWVSFENYCRALAQAGNELLILCGPSGFGTNRIPSGKVVIPDYTWKIAVVVPTGNGTALSRITTSTRVIALKIPNNNSVSNAWQNYVTSASQIEADTGFTFFTALATNLASALRNKVDGQGETNVLAGWDLSGLPGGINNFGPSPLAPTTSAANLTIAGLTRGSGIGTTGTGAARGWGGNTFTDAGSAAAIAANRFISFSVSAATGYTASYSSISRFDYRHSATGPANGLLQYQIGSGAFIDINTISYPTNGVSSTGSLSPINLSGISALQNVGAGTNVTFRIVNWGGTSSAGTWYLFDTANSPAPDFALQGTVTPVLTPIEAWRQQWFGTTNNAGIAADNYSETGDGMPNLLKYALGLDPLIAATNPVTGDISTGHLRLTAPKNPNATDVTFQVEITADLTAPWTTNGTTVDQDTPTLLQVHDNAPVDASAGGFIRLRVTQP
jgi:endonuclease G